MEINIDTKHWVGDEVIYSKSLLSVARTPPIQRGVITRVVVNDHYYTPTNEKKYSVHYIIDHNEAEEIYDLEIKVNITHTKIIIDEMVMI